MMSDVPTPDETAELAGRLRLAITRLARQLRQTSDTDLSPTQGSVLATVGTSGPLTLGELAELERVASPTITKVIALLHEKGLVDKITDPADRRFVRVQPARLPAGRTLHRTACLSGFPAPSLVNRPAPPLTSGSLEEEAAPCPASLRICR